MMTRMPPSTQAPWNAVRMAWTRIVRWKAGFMRWPTVTAAVRNTWMMTGMAIRTWTRRARRWTVMTATQRVSPLLGGVGRRDRQVGRVRGEGPAESRLDRGGRDLALVVGEILGGDHVAVAVEGGVAHVRLLSGSPGGTGRSTPAFSSSDLATRFFISPRVWNM